MPPPTSRLERRRRLRRPLIIAVVAPLLGTAAVVVAVVRHGGCALPAPTIQLSAEMRSTGLLGSPLAADDSRGLQEFSERAGQALDRTNLLSTTALQPLTEHALRADRHDATVVALRRDGPAGPRVAALAIFLDDCAGGHYFTSLSNLIALHGVEGLPSAFPALSQAEAAERLGVSHPQLSYDEEPAAPVWRDPLSGGIVAAT